LAEAVTASLKPNSDNRIITDKFESITGKGVVTNYGTHIYLVGNQKLLDDYKVNIPLAQHNTN
jgi:cation transport ATPase